ncbi:hypothetical protein F5Y17DRAFT_15347 [Xylariaceae sp. FL0594]|nr:hypothetical protein F5Y17DRAFT_15347 [Xylariaceae sp. FL0594]
MPMSLSSTGRIPRLGQWPRIRSTNGKSEKQPAIGMSQVQRCVPAPPKSSHSYRKPLPPLPPLADIERDAAEAAASPIHVTPSNGQGPRNISPARGGPEKELPVPFRISISQSPKPISREAVKPTTISKRRLSFISIYPKRRLKYGTGKYSTVELSPQPSDDPDDPLNWPKWKKNLHFFALVFMVGIVGVMKTALVCVHAVISGGQGINYTSAVALTAVPLMLSSLAGMGSTILAKAWGKRPVYLASAALIFVGSACDITTRGPYSQNMAGRILQGLGWGAFDTLVLGSILDMFFEHERRIKILVYDIVSFTSMWGTPLVGGVLSTGSGGYSTQFDIFTALLVLSGVLLVLGAPETTYTRSNSGEDGNLPLLATSQSKLPKTQFTRDAARKYLRAVKWFSYKAVVVDQTLLTQPLRAAIAPSSLLLFVITIIPYASLWGLASSLSLLFEGPPFGLSMTSVGLLFLGPFLLGSAAAIGARLLLLYRSRFPLTDHLVALALGTTLSSIGLLSFGLYMTGPIGSLERGAGTSFPVVSFLLGLVYFGSAALDGTIEPVVQQSTAFTSANMAVALRTTADMQAGVTCLRHLAAGVFVLGVPKAVSTLGGLQASAVGLGVVQIFVTMVVSAVYFKQGENVKRWDGIVMGLIDLAELKYHGSFFDTD